LRFGRRPNAFATALAILEGRVELAQSRDREFSAWRFLQPQRTCDPRSTAPHSGRRAIEHLVHLRPYLARNTPCRKPVASRASRISRAASIDLSYSRVRVLVALNDVRRRLGGVERFQRSGDYPLDAVHLSPAATLRPSAPGLKWRELARPGAGMSVKGAPMAIRDRDGQSRIHPHQLPP
jgi:hypothetical protein